MNVRAIDAETDMNSGRISSKLTRKLTWAEPAELLCIGLSRGMAAEQANSHFGTASLLLLLRRRDMERDWDWRSAE